MRGRKPLPTARRELTGNAGRRPLNTQEPQPPAPDTSFDDPPAMVQESLHAADEWRRLAPMLRTTRQITEADRSALVALCLEWGRYLDALGRVKNNVVVTTASGYPMPNPFLSVAQKALSACLKLWPELGLTPSSRSRVAVPDGPNSDPFAEFDTADPITPTLKPH